MVADGPEVVDMVGLALVNAKHEGAVVTGDDDDGVFSLFRLVQDLEDLADGVVRLHDKIAVDAVVGLAFKLVTGDDRFVRRGQREIEKEGLLGLR